MEGFWRGVVTKMTTDRVIAALGVTFALLQLWAAYLQIKAANIQTAIARAQANPMFQVYVEPARTAVGYPGTEGFEFTPSKYQRLHVINRGGNAFDFSVDERTWMEIGVKDQPAKAVKHLLTSYYTYWLPGDAKTTGEMATKVAIGEISRVDQLKSQIDSAQVVPRLGASLAQTIVQLKYSDAEGQAHVSYFQAATDSSIRLTNDVGSATWDELQGAGLGENLNVNKIGKAGLLERLTGQQWPPVP